MISTPRAALPLLLVTLFGCAAPAGDISDEREDTDEARAEDALVAIPKGDYALVRAPASGSYVSKLRLGDDRAVELDYVRVTTVMEPWVWNPFVQVPVTKREELTLRGRYRTYRGDGDRTMIAFDLTDGDRGVLLYELELSPGAVRLRAIGGATFELRRTAPDVTPTDTRVLRCEGHTFAAVIRLDEAARRRGTLAITRNARAGRLDPPNGEVEVVYTGGTGVRDYMAYSGRDAAGGRYEFALRRSELERTSGPTSNVGLGYTPPLGWGAMHNTLTCTIGVDGDR